MNLSKTKNRMSREKRGEIASWRGRRWPDHTRPVVLCEMLNFTKFVDLGLEVIAGLDQRRDITKFSFHKTTLVALYRRNEKKSRAVSEKFIAEIQASDGQGSEQCESNGGGESGWSLNTISRQFGQINSDWMRGVSEDKNTVQFISAIRRTHLYLKWGRPKQESWKWNTQQLSLQLEKLEMPSRH